ncbi:hypothetical protein NIES4074_64660 (plasmid) [Cylindrospermum sp. NIES-4074]|nr:hypothetical protein NIES4074_64660 [Cylindrospermum sp. NIES-4074]
MGFSTRGYAYAPPEAMARSARSQAIAFSMDVKKHFCSLEEAYSLPA